ncbi:MAG: GMC oxidoreductase [Actinomycetes bacterium]
MATGRTERRARVPGSGRTRAPEHVDAVVVGSGFGGSVSAYRLAEGGLRVLLLERGKAYPPGSFGRTAAELGRSFWDPSEGRHGMFDVWTFRGLEAVVSSGLGGGSLIYANVLLRKDERWFVHEQPIPGGGYESWPVSRADLDPHYDRVEQMMGVQRYPFAEPGYAQTPKTVAMRRAASRMGLDWHLPPLAVSFAPRPGDAPVVGAPIPVPEYGNIHGLPRSTCRLCGECDIGCNDGAKNTLDHTYLSAAAHEGAEIRTRSEVRGLRPLSGGGYEVRYVEHEPQSEGRRTRTDRLPERTVTCDRLVLGAGTLGTTFLLLNNRAAFPNLSGALGTRFCGNGDLLTFILRAQKEGTAELLDGSRGPVITSTMRAPDEADGAEPGARGYYLQDAGFPSFATWLLEATQTKQALRRALRFAYTRARARLTHSGKTGIGAELAALLGSGDLSSASLPLLGMGRDTPDGRLFLRKGHLESTWSLTTSEDYFGGLRDTMREVARELGGEFHDNPLWWGRHVVTVHALGGSPMGAHAGEGVCDAYGEVFGHPGLYVVDGAAMPGPVGPNPSLTIAAMADRACDRMLGTPVEHAQARRSGVPEPRVVREAPAADATSLSFTEEMKGFVTLGETDPERGAQTGRARGDRLMFHLTITADDVDAFVTDPAHQGHAEGWVECDLLGGRRAVSRGVFNLFTNEGDPTRRFMRYRLWFTDGGGSPVTLSGFKDVHDDPGLDLWRDTTTLFVRLLAGHVEPEGDEAADVIGAGVITIHLQDFARQLTTFRTHGPDGPRAMARFGRLFLGELWDTHGPSKAGSVDVRSEHEEVPR